MHYVNTNNKYCQVKVQYWKFTTAENTQVKYLKIVLVYFLTNKKCTFSNLNLQFMKEEPLCFAGLCISFPCDLTWNMILGEQSGPWVLSAPAQNQEVMAKGESHNSRLSAEIHWSFLLGVKDYKESKQRCRRSDWEHGHEMRDETLKINVSRRFFILKSTEFFLRN